MCYITELARRVNCAASVGTHGYTGLSLVRSDHVTWILASHWLTHAGCDGQTRPEERIKTKAALYGEQNEGKD